MLFGMPFSETGSAMMGFSSWYALEVPYLAQAYHGSYSLNGGLFHGNCDARIFLLELEVMPESGYA